MHILQVAIYFIVLSSYDCGIARLNTSNTGDYNILVKNSLWLNSAPVFFRVNNETHTLHETLETVNYEAKNGRDDLGDFFYRKYTLKTSCEHFFEIWIRDYSVTDGNNFFTFDQVYLNDTKGTLAEDCENTTWHSLPGSLTCYNYTISAFPSFYVTQQTAPTLGFLTFVGDMIGDANKQMGIWDNRTWIQTDGMESGPLAIFDEKGNTLLISPLDKFMTSLLWHQNFPGGRVNWGTMGGVTDVPAGFTMRTIIVFESGINKAFSTLHDVFQKQYLSNGLKNTFRASDKTISHLGYWTDHGAFYYYNRETIGRTGWNITYDQTLTDVKAYADKIKVPYRYLQIDSWWYYDGVFSGVKEWRYRWDVFPGGGPSYVSNTTGWPLAAQNKYWDSDVVYSKYNGGQYNFIQEEILALPDDPTFWTYLMENAKKWNVILYEQSWLSFQTLYTFALQTDLEIGERWLQQMNDAAQRLNISIQYGMALPRHALQSLLLPTVTQARVSEDYHLNEDQWKIGISSIFADAVGLVPFKDTFWTTPKQNGNPKYPNITEPFPALQSLVATLSGGPVGPGDKLRKTDRELLMRCCNDDGLILKPSHPAKAIDQQIIKTAIPHSSGPSGEVWTTYTEIPGESGVDVVYFGILFAADLDEDFTVYPNMTGFPYPLLSNTLVYSYNMYNHSIFDDQHPLHLTGCTKKDFCLFYFSTIYFMNGTRMALIGEASKWVPVSPQRVTKITNTPINLNFYISGAENETVTMYYWKDGNRQVIQCKLGASGHTVMRTSMGFCVDDQPISRPSSPNQTQNDSNVFTGSRRVKTPPGNSGRKYGDNDSRV